jgi:hypothetical protein
LAAVKTNVYVDGFNLYLNPHERFSVELRKVATFRKQIRNGALAASQFPATLTDANGTITKPAGW